MIDYVCLRLRMAPFSTDAADLMAAYLVEIGYESFVTEEDGLSAYIMAKSFNEVAVKDILEEYPIPIEIEYSFYTEKGKDWNEEWEKNYFQPIIIDEECVIHSSFHSDYPKLKYEIVIDPKMAFGTGHHATTTMMVSQMLQLDLKGKVVTDMGTGTGILAILASMLGAKEVSAIEIDPGAVDNARENVLLNDKSYSKDLSSGHIKVYEGDAEVIRSLPRADVFLANINRNVILADLPLYVEGMNRGAILLLSGFYEADIPIIEKAASLYGLKMVSKRVYEGDWASVRMLLV